MYAAAVSAATFVSEMTVKNLSACALKLLPGHPPACGAWGSVQECMQQQSQHPKLSVRYVSEICQHVLRHSSLHILQRAGPDAVVAAAMVAAEMTAASATRKGMKLAV